MLYPPGYRHIHSPYEGEAWYRAKGSTEWMGYKVHLSKICDEGQPHVITNFETTSAVELDVLVTEHNRQSLKAKRLLPEEHLLDGSYIDAELFVSAQDD